MAHISSNLLRMQGRYYYRQRVPLDLVPALDKKEIRKGLKTSCPKVARMVSVRLRGLLDNCFDEIRIMTKDSKWKETAKGLEAEIESLDKIGETIEESQRKEAQAHVDRLVDQSKNKFEKDVLNAVLDSTDQLRKEAEAEKEATLQRLATSEHEKALANQNVSNLTQALVNISSAPQMVQQPVVVPQPPVMAPEAPKRDLGVLLQKEEPKASLPKFSHFVQDFYEEQKAKGASQEKLRHYKAAFKVFMFLVGDKSIDEYSRKDFLAYKTNAESLDANFARSDKRIQSMTVEEALKFKSKEPVKYTETTLSKHFNYVTTVFRLAGRSHPSLNLAVYEDIKMDGRESETRSVWSIDDLKALFATPVWTGRKGLAKNQTYHPGKRFFKDEYFWLPVLGLYTGMRLEELCKLRVEDIHEEDGIPYIDVNDEFGRVKTQSSVRQVPIHPDLFNFGFQELIDAAKEVNEDRVFFKLDKGTQGKYNEEYTKHFGHYCEMTEIYQRWRDFHAFRHTFASYLYDCIREVLVISAICGHSASEIDSLGDLKGKGFNVQTTEYIHIDLKAKYEAMKALKFDGLDLSHLERPGKRH